MSISPRFCKNRSFFVLCLTALLKNWKHHLIILVDIVLLFIFIEHK